LVGIAINEWYTAQCTINGSKFSFLAFKSGVIRLQNITHSPVFFSQIKQDSERVGEGLNAPFEPSSRDCLLSVGIFHLYYTLLQKVRERNNIIAEDNTNNV